MKGNGKRVVREMTMYSIFMVTALSFHNHPVQGRDLELRSRSISTIVGLASHGLRLAPAQCRLRTALWSILRASLNILSPVIIK